MLDDKLKAKLQKPFGDLCSSGDCVEKLRAFSNIVTVGDITTYNVLGAGIVPDVCVVDGITMREKVPDEICRAISIDQRAVFEVDNPPGSISQELQKAMSESMQKIEQSQRARIIVHGEEDLAVIPAVIEAPVGTAIVYGQPGEGMVIITATREKKAKAKRLLREIRKPD
jgi:uncharacterized protein (UPF0218 family)